MATYTLHLVFSANGTVYHIYGTRQNDNAHEFGSNYNIDPSAFYKINIVALEKKATKGNTGEFLDYGNWAPDSWRNDATRYTEQANLAKASGKTVFLINCKAGALRTRIMAARLYMLLAEVGAGAALGLINSPKGEKESRYKAGDAPLVKGDQFTNSDQIGNMKLALGL